jgi:hypothetical protein
MTKHTAEQWVALYQAYIDGKTIQIKTKTGWFNAINPGFNEDIEKYRIKPKLIEGWTHVYKQNSKRTVRYLYNSEAQALSETPFCDFVRVAHMIEVEE